MQVKLGFSTGALYKTNLDLVDRVKVIRAAGCQAIELSFLKPEEFNETELKKLLVYGNNDLKHFHFVSLHAPVYPYDFNGEKRRIFDLIDWLNEWKPLNLVVFHPDVIANLNILQLPTFEVAIENMDHRKPSFKKVGEMEAVLKRNHKLAMVLDIMHAYSNDPTLKLVDVFYQRLGNKIAAVHLSGFKDGHHAPLFQTGQVEIIKAIQDLSIPPSFGVPVIVGSVLEAGQLEQERGYILQILDGIGK